MRGGAFHPSFADFQTIMADSDMKTKTGKRGWIKWVLVSILLLLVAAVLVVTIAAKKLLTADALVAKFEEKYNCRLELGEFNVSGLTGTTKIELKNVRLAERDAVADAGTPHDQRTPLEADVLRVASVTLEANAADLLKKTITLKQINISGLGYYTVIQKDGSHRLEPLFDPPIKINGAANPKFEEQMKRREEAKARKKMTREERKTKEPEVFNIAEFPMPATMEKFHIGESQIEVKLKKTKTRITIRDIDLTLSDLDIDPSDLKNHNSAKMRLNAGIDLEDNEREVKYADLKVSSDGTVIPFDEVTGYANPDIAYDITMHKGSMIKEVPALIKAGREKLQKYGVSVEEIGRDLLIEEDTTMKLSFHEGQMRTEQDFDLKFSGNTLLLAKGSWWNSGTNEHEIPGSILISEATTKKARGQAEAFLAKKYGLNQDLVAKIANVLLLPVMREEKMWMPFVSKGDFSRPKVEAVWEELLDAGDIIKGEAKGKAMELLNGLLNE